MESAELRNVRAMYTSLPRLSASQHDRLQWPPALSWNNSRAYLFAPPADTFSVDQRLPSVDEKCNPPTNHSPPTTSWLNDNTVPSDVPPHIILWQLAHMLQIGLIAVSRGFDYHIFLNNNRLSTDELVFSAVRITPPSFMNLYDPTNMDNQYYHSSWSWLTE